MSHIAFPALLATCLLAASASAQQSVDKPAPPSAAVKLTAQASNDFACDLFRELAKDNANKNLFVSPWSISSALAMTMEGARNDTALEMGQTLRLPKELRRGGDQPWRLDPYHEGFADMLRRCTPPRDPAKDKTARAKIADLRMQLAVLNKKSQLQGGDAYVKAQKVAEEINRLEKDLDLFELNVANAIWGDKTYPFDRDYVETVGRHYGTGLVRQADFINNFPAERLKINRWVEDQTKNKIKELIPEMKKEEGELIRMILVNAIYFKGQWSEPFKKEYTKDEPFLLADGTKTPTPLMRQTQTARYAAFNADESFFETPQLIGRDDKTPLYPKDDGFVVAELPYKGNRLAMTVIVPQSPKGLDALEKKLNGGSLTRWLGRLESRNVVVWLPKFKMDTDYSLAKPLGRLGMKQAFDDRSADFSGMSKSGKKLYISAVLHKAFVDVNEEGTEAAAATAVLMGAVVDSKPAAFPFNPTCRADRPFLFFIREVDTGAVLFMGRMTIPQ